MERQAEKTAVSMSDSETSHSPELDTQPGVFGYHPRVLSEVNRFVQQQVKGWAKVSPSENRTCQVHTLPANPELTAGC